MVFNPVGLAAIGIGATGAILTFIATQLSGPPWGQMLVFGPLILALGFTLGAVAFGLRNPYVILALFAILAILFVGFDTYAWYGVRLI